jgi:hypothetical protein
MVEKLSSSKGDLEEQVEAIAAAKAEGEATLGGQVATLEGELAAANAALKEAESKHGDAEGAAVTAARKEVPVLPELPGGWVCIALPLVLSRLVDAR